MHTGVAAALTVALVLAGGSAARAQAPDPLPRYVLDIHGVTAGLPTAVGWTPVIPATTEVPSRGLGLEGGAHVFVARGRTVSLGVGASWLLARSSTSTAADDETTPSPPQALPDVSSRLTLLTPQVSLNFGHRLGWSYISAGLGRGRISSVATDASGATVENGVDDWTRVIDFGGGARWFVSDRLGVSFDLRWHQLAARTDATTGASAPGETVLVLGVGLSIQ